MKKTILFCLTLLAIWPPRSQQWTTSGSNTVAVNGTIEARKVLVTQANPFPDYVFDSGYRLPSLEELNRYILSNHHLPEVPSADSIEKSGLDVGAGQVILLKKIEELTLYLIQQGKKVEVARQDNLRLAERLEKLKAENRIFRRKINDKK